MTTTKKMSAGRKIKKEVIVTMSELVKVRLPDVDSMTLAVWRLFVNFNIPRKIDEFYRDIEGNYHFIEYYK